MTANSVDPLTFSHKTDLSGVELPEELTAEDESTSRPTLLNGSWQSFLPLTALALAALTLLLSARTTAALPVVPTGPTEIISAGAFHNCALTPAGAVDCWGDNFYGQAADQTGPFTQVSAGASHTCALTPAGAVDCWGYNGNGQAADQPGPYTQVSAGGHHTCALTPAGAVDCWGRNVEGQATDQPGPYTQVSAGYAYTCAVTPAGAVDCWGLNTSGQADDQAGPYTQVSASQHHTCALTPTGAVDCWGDNSYGQAADQTGPFTQVSTGNHHNCALTPTGAVDCWGYNFYGQAEDQTGPYTQVSAGLYHNCALTPAGAVDCWGYDGNGQANDQTGPFGPYLPPALPEIISAGYFHTCGLTPTGAVDCWGWNDYGQAVDQTGPYTQVSASYFHTCALTPAGAVECWGYNHYGEADDQAGPYTQVNAGVWDTCALTPAGAVDCWGGSLAIDQPGPYTQVSAGFFHTCALTPAGAVDCWGSNGDGQAVNQTGPYTQVSAGYWHTCALTPAGDVDCWGNNGEGRAEDQTGPYTQVSAGGGHTCALTPAGAVDCWGNNGEGRAEDQTGPYTQVSAGGGHTCALTPAGAVDCWGYNGDGQADDQTGPFGPYVPPVVTACPASPSDGTVGPERTTLLGRGMGSPTRQKLVGKLTVPNVAELTDLYGQMAAKEYTAVRFVRFIYPDRSYEQVPRDTGIFDEGEKAAISWWGADLDTTKLQDKPLMKGRFFLHKGMRKMKVPRAFVLYMTHQTEGQYANAWSTFTSPNNFVAGAPGFPQTNTNVLSIPETQETTDIVVQLAVTDVNRDPRTVDVIVRAGGVEVTTTLTGPTNKKSELLNLFEVTLEDVPAGVDEVEIELVSVLDEGDSAALLGAAAHYECVDVPVEPDPTFSLGDRVWYDQDQDGIQDANEPGIPQSVGLYVELDFDPDCDHQPNLSVLAGASGGDGNYLFSGLAAGDYCLDFGETFPFGWSFSPANQGGDDTKDSDVDSGGLIMNINLTADDDTRDAGVYVAGSLSGTVSCRDEGTRDSIRAIDPALPNVTVTLFEDFDGDGVADGPAIATTESDGSGYYAFTNLEVALAGDANNTTKYIVQVDVNDADLGSCNTPVGPTQYNPELDSSSPDSPFLDFTFERIPV